MKKLSISLTILLSLFYLQPIFANAPLKDSTCPIRHIEKITNPQEFVTKLYFYILSHQDCIEPTEIPKLFFTQSLLERYMKVVARDQKSSEVGCLNGFNNFTGAQDYPFGCWVGKPTFRRNEILVPVYLNITEDKFDVKKPTITVHLLSINNEFKIDDIDYFYSDATKQSLRSIILNCKV